jgi:DmsE family decaheme c-type cytochrome
LGQKLLSRYLTGAAVLIPLLIFSISYGKYADKDEIMEQTETCLLCHDGQAETLQGTPHQLLSEDDISPSIMVGCTGCHIGWEDHVDDPAADNIVAGPGLGSLEQAQQCNRCHQTPHQAAMATTDAHGRNGYNCSSCHTIHGNQNRMLVKDERENYCLECHNVVEAQFKARSAHPLESGNIRCTDCHQFGNIADQLHAQGLDWTCQECHPLIAGPHIYEHPVTYEHLVEGSGCTECHNPHGSPNDRLLKQPGDGTCRQCHMVPPGHRIAHAGLGSRHACIDCHSEIHGSNSNELFLDPELGMKNVINCYASGCHSLER